MEKVLVVIEPKNNKGLGLNAFYEGKVVLGQVKVGDSLKIYTKGFDAVKDVTVVGLAVENKIVDGVENGTEIRLRVSRFESDAYLLTNNLNLLHSCCVIEFEDAQDSENWLKQRLNAHFPDEYNFVCVAQTGKKMLGSNKKPQIQLELCQWFYLYLGQKIELKLGEKSIPAKIVKILK